MPWILGKKKRGVGGTNLLIMSSWYSESIFDVIRLKVKRKSKYIILWCSVNRFNLFNMLFVWWFSWDIPTLKAAARQHLFCSLSREFEYIIKVVTTRYLYILGADALVLEREIWSFPVTNQLNFCKWIREHASLSEMF